MADTQMEDAHQESEHTKQLPLSEQEKEILDMYDEVQKLELEVALTRARVRLASGCTPLWLSASKLTNDP